MLSFVKSIFKGYWKDDCTNYAAVISFYAIFSVLPLTMIAVATLAYVLGSSEDLIVRFQGIIESVFPTVAEELFRIVQSALEKRQKVSFISAGILILLASFLVSSLEAALDRVFRTERKRNFFHSRGVAIAFTFVFILLFAAPGLLQLVQTSLIQVKVLKESLIPPMSGDVFFFFVAFTAFLLTVTVIPNHKVYFRYSFFGAIAFTVLTGVARIMFRMYIAVSWSRYNLIYDSLSVLIILIVWIYYMANIFLLCAETVARLQERRLRS